MSGAYEALEQLFNEYVESDGERQINIPQLKIFLQTVSDNELLQMLLEVDSSFEAVVCYAARQGHTELIRAIVEHIQQPEQRFLLQLTRYQGAVPMHFAASYGHLEAVKCIIESIPEIDRVLLLDDLGMNNKTVLHYAAESGYVNVMEYILNQLFTEKASEMIRQETTNGETVIFTAAATKNVFTIELLLNKILAVDAADILKRQNRDGYTAVMYAAKYGYTGSIKCILGHFSPDQQLILLEQRGNVGITAERLALEFCHADTFSFLQELSRTAEKEVRAAEEPPPRAPPNIIAKMEELDSLKEQVTANKIKSKEEEAAVTEQIIKLERKLAATKRQKKRLQSR